MNNKKLIRITTIPASLNKLLSGQLQFMKNHFEVIAVSSEKNNLKELGESEQVNVFYVEMTRKITPFKDLLAIIKLFVYLKKQKPYIVHTHTPKAGLVGMVAAKLANVPNRLHSVAGLPLLEATGSKRKILDFVEKLIYSCATKVYPNSNGLKHIIEQNKYCNTYKIKVLANGSSNGINTSYFNRNLFSEDQNTTLKNYLQIEEDDIVFIFVGRIVGDKGINELVEAFKKVNSDFVKTKLLLVGPLEPDLDPINEKTLDEIQKNNNIIFVDFKDDVRPYFAISNVLVFPSYREGFPNVVMQACAMNLPCIVSDINGCNEIIKENVNGFIIPVKDKLAIVKAMLKFLNNKELLIKLTSNTRDIIISKYEQKVVWDAILEEYKNL